LIFAPQVSNLTYKLSKSYLNASPKHKTMDNIFIVKGRSQENFSKILFNLKSTNISNSSRSQSVSEDSISEKKKYIKTNKYLSLFRTEFKLSSNLKKNVMKYFYVNKSSTVNNISSKNAVSAVDSTRNRYSVLKTFLSKPEIKYSSNNVSIILYIYNKKNMFTLKKMQKNFNLVKLSNTALLNNISLKDIQEKSIINLKNKLICKLSNKSSISFFLYM
jgi:hypothetical protein